MLRNRKRRETVSFPFRLRYNFRRKPQGTTIPSNDDNEPMLHENFDNGNEINFNDNDGNDILEQRNNLDDDVSMRDDDDYTTSSEYDDDDDDATSSEYEEEEDEATFSESEVNYTTSESEESDTDPSSEEKIFVDMALDEDNLPQFNGNFAPYFQDFTTAALFCWIHKHNISTNAYEDLIDIIMNQEFDRNHIVKNI